MLFEQTIDKLNQMKLFGMVSELERQLKTNDISLLSFEERFSLIVDVEVTSRENRRLKRLLSNAHLRENACIEDIDFRAERGIDKSFILSLANCSWVEKHLNAIIVGPTGVGKTYIACALGNAACRQGYSAIYYRTPRLLNELKMARADGSFVKLLNRLAKTDLLLIDDWGLNTLSSHPRHIYWVQLWWLWALSCLADLPVASSLVCGFCSSVRDFAFDFLQIQPHG